MDVESIESLTGQLQSMKLAIPAAPIFIRSLYDTVRDANMMDALTTRLTSEAAEELVFWRDNLRTMNGTPIKCRAETIAIHVDASATGIGATTEDKSFSVPLPEGMVDISSTARELWTVLRVFERWGKSLRGEHVRFVMDSLPAARNLVKGGGPVTELSNMVKNIWREAKQCGASYTVTWVEREQNQRADVLSKGWADWYRLSSHARTKLERDLARDGAAGLHIENPPFAQIGYAVRKAMWQKRPICLVHPVWTAQQWWPAIARCARRELGMAAEVLTEGTGKQHPRWRIQAALLYPDE